MNHMLDATSEVEAMDVTFAPATIASDLVEVRRIYAGFLAGSLGAAWDQPVKRGSEEWTLHETMAHLCALNGAGLDSAKHTLRGEPYTFVGLDDRYVFDAYNRRGIDEHLEIARGELSAEFLGILDEAATIAGDLGPDRADLSAWMPIYNRPVRVREVLSIILFHVGLAHTAQVAEPVGLPPLWTELSLGTRHRLVTRTMLCLSLLYRHDIGDPLRARIAFRIGGPDGGDWYIDVSPGPVTFGEGVVERPSLAIRLRDTSVFFQMFTGRFHLPSGLISGRMKLRGDLRLFLRMSALFSVDARPKVGSRRRIEGHKEGGSR